MSKQMSENEKERLRIQALYKKVFLSPEGNEVLVDIVRSIGLFDSSHMPSTVDPNGRDSAYQNGMKEVGLRILSTIDFDLGCLIIKILLLFEPLSSIPIYFLFLFLFSLN